MDKLVIKNYLDDPQGVLDFIETSIREEDDWWYRYQNSFESKWAIDKQRYDDTKLNQQVLDNAFYVTNPLLFQVMLNLAHPDTCWWVQRLLDVPIEYGDVQHYGGVFVYGNGDYLKPHCDAGIHPYDGQHKVATACLYLTPAVLYFYKGDPAWFDKPLVHHIDQVLHIPANSLVLFTNHDTAWHEVPLVTSPEPRAVITVSYMAPSDFKDPRFMNTRTRAYFARHMSILDSPELAELRELRASEEHHRSVYRTTTLSEAPAATQDWPLNL